MRVGDLRIPFILQEQEASDGTWIDVCALWGSLNPVDNSEGSHIAVLRAPEDDVPVVGMRLLWGARAFLIVSAKRVDEENRWISLSLREVEGL